MTGAPGPDPPTPPPAIFTAADLDKLPDTCDACTDDAFCPTCLALLVRRFTDSPPRQ